MCRLKDFFNFVCVCVCLFFGYKITPISEGKKKKKYNFHKGFHRKKSPKFDKFTTFHFKETKIKITKFGLKVQTSHQK